jgi:4-hydroxy-2-oxovalerate aldolase
LLEAIRTTNGFMSLFDIKPDILEVTLRDGSYLIDFQFTAEDTATIASALEAAGFRWIEVGHGVGLGASREGKGAAAASDEEYLEAAAKVLSRARWGMFFIPRIGRAEDLRLAAHHKMSFVRIGTNVTEVDDAERFIGLAKELGFLVSYNAMKSYAVSPEEFGRCVVKVSRWGADVACLVDSAGSMHPDTVSTYLRAAKAVSDSPLGFHGHDNLSLAMANTLRAIDEGAVLVDSSLQGMGRSAGNAITEVLVAVLQQRNLLPGIDLKAAMDIGQGLIQPLLGRRGVDPMAVTSGLASFHSSFMPKVQSYAHKYEVDVRDLIVRLCQEDLVSAPDELLERLSRELAARKMPRMLTIPAFSARQRKGSHAMDPLEELVKQLRIHAVKGGRFSTVNVVIGERELDGMQVSGNIHNTRTHAIGSVTLSNEEQLISVLRAVDGKVDLVLLDLDRKPFGPPSAAESAHRELKKSVLLTYLDSRVWVEAIDNQSVRLLGEVLTGVPIVIAGDHPKSRFLALRFAERRARVSVLVASKEEGFFLEKMQFFTSAGDLDVAYLANGSPGAETRLSEAHLVVAWPGGEPWFGAAEAAYLNPGAYILDARIGGLLPEALEEAQRRGVLPIRVNVWPALAGALSAAHETLRNNQECLGWGKMGGVAVVSGGALGRKGDIIIDSLRNPTRVIGMADGTGGVSFQFTLEQSECVRRVREEIIQRLVQPRMTGVGAG